MADWTVTFLLPSVYVKEPVETGFAALTSCDDERVVSLANQHANLKSFLKRFTNPFGVEVRPSLIILRTDAPRSFWTIDAVSSFRDAIALAAIVSKRAKALNFSRAFSPQYTDWFEFYPWSLDKKYGNLICNTPALRGLHVVDEFRGQSAPAVSPTILDRRDFDRPLMAELLRRWERRYLASMPRWIDMALFRSLNMAYSASKMPAGPDATMLAFGRSLALWVSAFEILVHPKTSASGFQQVYALLEAVPWYQNQCKYRKYKAYVSRNSAQQKKAPRRNLACWIYGQVHSARNDFLHGNPISATRLDAMRSKRGLSQYLAPLYRMALTGFLPLVPPATTSSGEAFDRSTFDFYAYQRDAESALRTILTRPN